MRRIDQPGHESAGCRIWVFQVAARLRRLSIHTKNPSAAAPATLQTATAKITGKSNPEGLEKDRHGSGLSGFHRPMTQAIAR